MKNKAIITTSLVVLALLSGCNKGEESTTKTQESTTTVTTPAPTGEPATSKTQESTTTTTTDTKGQ